MMRSALCTLRLPLAAACFVLLGGMLQPAVARVWVGFGFPLAFGFPYYYAPPMYYPPPPAYYPPPPPVYYAPPPPAYPPQSYGYQYGQAPSARQSCETGGAVCPMERPVPRGSSCYCTTAQGRAWGRAT